jgi:hypothetical protein
VCIGREGGTRCETNILEHDGQDSRSRPLAIGVSAAGAVKRQSRVRVLPSRAVFGISGSAAVRSSDRLADVKPFGLDRAPWLGTSPFREERVASYAASALRG